MVESVDADSLASWQAVAIIDGWGEDNERTARLCVSIHNALMVAAAKQGGQVDEADFKDLVDYLPKFKFEKPKPAVQTPEQMMAIAKRLTGMK